MPDKAQIQHFFDSVSCGRDAMLDGHHVIRYEQLRRQQMVLRLLDPQPSERILDVGCGNGRDLRVYSARHARPTGVDFSFGMLADARRELRGGGYPPVPLVQADATRLPLAAHAFDKVACSEVIEHVPDPAALLQELHRVLKPGGRVVITTPNRRSLYGAYRVVGRAWQLAVRVLKRLPKEHEGGHPYDEWKTNAELRRMLERAGFVVSRIRNACYVPSHATYMLPPAVQRLIVAPIAGLERKLEDRLTVFGYDIGIEARKP